MHFPQARPYSRHFTGHLPPGETGCTFELDYLYSPGEERTLGVHEDDPVIPMNLTFREAIRYCIAENPYRYAPENLSDPQSRDMNTVHLSICQELQCENEQVKMFPSIHTAADRRGIDFFVIYHDAATGQDFLVTADLTQRREKIERGTFAADVLVTPRGCFANPRYYEELVRKGGQGVGYFFLENSGHDLADRDDRALGTDKVIAHIIREKVRAIRTGNPHPNPEHYILGSERERIKRLLSEVVSPPEASKSPSA